MESIEDYSRIFEIGKKACYKKNYITADSALKLLLETITKKNYPFFTF